MDAGAEGASPFAVDDADTGDAVFLALVEILGEEAGDFLGAEGVEIELSGDGDVDGFGSMVGGLGFPGFYGEVAAPVAL